MNGRGILMAIGGMMITAGIGFIAGSKWTEKRLSCKLEDLYSEEYNLLKRNLEKKFESKETELTKRYEAKEQELKEKYCEVEEGSVDDSGSSDGDSDESDTEKPKDNRRKPQSVNPIREIKKSDGSKKANNYADLVENDDFDPPEDSCGRTEPYIIDYDTYFQDDGYTEKPLTYDWQNHILIDDENGNVLEDVDLIVGWNNLEEFEESDDCLVYIRDDSLKVDYIVEKMDYRL